MRLTRIGTPPECGYRNCDRDTPSSSPQRSESVPGNQSHAHSLTELVHEIVHSIASSYRI